MRQIELEPDEAALETAFVEQTELADDPHAAEDPGAESEEQVVAIDAAGRRRVGAFAPAEIGRQIEEFTQRAKADGEPVAARTVGIEFERGGAGREPRRRPPQRADIPGTARVGEAAVHSADRERAAPQRPADAEAPLEGRETGEPARNEAAERVGSQPIDTDPEGHRTATGRQVKPVAMAAAAGLQAGRAAFAEPSVVKEVGLESPDEAEPARVAGERGAVVFQRERLAGRFGWRGDRLPRCGK